MKRTPRIALIAGGHIASTPRMVKEADALHGRGMEVLAVGVQNVPMVSAMDRELQKSRPWAAANVKREGRGLLGRAWARLRRSGAERNVSSLPLDKLSRAIVPGGDAILAEIRRFAPDLVIAHSIAGLTIAALAREIFGVEYAFDMEDYHPGECAGDLSVPSNRVANEVLNRFLKGARYVTAASPCIAEEAARVFGVREIVPILNSFPLENPPTSPPRDRDPGGLSLYWFSQTVGLDRGIQDAIAACGRLRGEVQLHLRGGISVETRRRLRDLAAKSGVERQLRIHGWCKADDMLARAAEHDVGLALEPSVPLNRDLAISNKILLYPLAGLAVAATRTRGQSWVMDRMPDAGFMYESGNDGQLARGLQLWLDDPAALRAARRAARAAAEERFCWERESPRFLAAVEQTLAQGAKVQRHRGTDFESKANPP